MCVFLLSFFNPSLSLAVVCSLLLTVWASGASLIRSPLVPISFWVVTNLLIGTGSPLSSVCGPEDACAERDLSYGYALVEGITTAVFPFKFMLLRSFLAGGS